MFKLGKKAARPEAIPLKFHSIFNDTALPIPPTLFGKLRAVPDWLMLANDKVGCCVFSGSAHETMLWSSNVDGTPAPFADSDILEDYSAVTGYDPNDPSTDQGTDVAEAAEYRRKTGIVDSTGTRHKIDAYVSVHPNNLDHIALSAYLFGACGLGVNLPQSAIDQFTDAVPWDVPEDDSPIVGGHYVPVIGRNSKGYFLVVTWARIHAVSPAFITTYADEAVCYLSSFDWTRDNIDPRGVNLIALEDYFKQIG
jgi:hypothetical protein